MSDPTEPPKNISELIDRIDQIREELFKIQRSMEEMETAKPVPTVGSDEHISKNLLDMS